jgi:hypothetical protein
MREHMKGLPFYVLAFLFLYLISAKDAGAQAAPRVSGTLSGTVSFASGEVLDCVSGDNGVSIEFSYGLDNIDESSSGGGVYEFAPAWPDNFLSISINTADCNELTWTSGESFTLAIVDGSLDLFQALGAPLFQEYPTEYGEPILMGFQLSGSSGEMITMENGPSPVPFFSIHPQYIDDGGLIGFIAGGDWYIEFVIDDWQISEESDMNTGAVPVDIKPWRCKNRINLKRKWGYVWVGILGTEDLDVTQIDPASVMLEGVPASRWRYKDVTTPVEAATEQADCQQDCTNGSRDGYKDLILKFKKKKLIKALKALGYVEHHGCYSLELSGEMKDGTHFGGEDVIHVLNKKKKKKKNK